MRKETKDAAIRKLRTGTVAGLIVLVVAAFPGTSGLAAAPPQVDIVAPSETVHQEMSMSDFVAPQECDLLDIRYCERCAAFWYISDGWAQCFAGLFDCVCDDNTCDCECFCL
jgi:hypothetical protein